MDRVWETRESGRFEEDSHVFSWDVARAADNGEAQEDVLQEERASQAGWSVRAGFCVGLRAVPWV